MVLVSYRPIILVGCMAIGMDVLHAGRACATLPCLEEPMTTVACITAFCCQVDDPGPAPPTARPPGPVASPRDGRGPTVSRAAPVGVALRGRFFHNVLSMHTFVYQTPPLLSPGSSCRLRQGHGRLTGLVLPRGHRGPRFRDKVALRQGIMTQQRDQQRHPALAKDTDQPQASCPPRPRTARAQRDNVA